MAPTVFFCFVFFLFGFHHHHHLMKNPKTVKVSLFFLFHLSSHDTHTTRNMTKLRLSNSSSCVTIERILSFALCFQIFSLPFWIIFDDEDHQRIIHFFFLFRCWFWLLFADVFDFLFFSFFFVMLENNNEQVMLFSSRSLLLRLSSALVLFRVMMMMVSIAWSIGSLVSCHP